ncbi:TetR/AcrR family transcriptional regulator [Falsiroseomonas sp. HC035]|uniref:TetR/AcrR family transcriptional regulator n=1 Tax=Falsiroseomonas sp. HC035 TaxID=3390999 RepID=UPI003D313E3A
MPEEERRHLLQETAATIFLRDGYAAASMDDVARAAGMSKRTLYRAFPSKAELFETTISSTLLPLNIELEVERDPNVQTALTGILQATGQHLLAQRQTSIFRLVIAEVQRSPELAETWHRVLVSRGCSSLQRRLALEVAQGKLTLEDPVIAARMLYGMAFGAIQIRMLLGVALAPDAREMSAMVRDAVAVFLNGALRRA